MAGYKIINLKEVEDSAAKSGLGPDMEARFASGDLGLENSGISHQRLAPNFRQPFGHKHEEQEEIYVVLDGSARVKLDDEIVELKKWDALRVPPEITRCLEGGPEGAEFLAVGAPSTGDTSKDTAPIPNWWSD